MTDDDEVLVHITREALENSTTICEAIDAIDAAISSYCEAHESSPALREEAVIGLQAVARLLQTLTVAAFPCMCTPAQKAEAPAE